MNFPVNSSFVVASSEYVEWNRRLLDFCIAHSVDADSRFYLNVREMLSEEEDETRAEESFRLTVAATYKSFLAVSRDPIRHLCLATDYKGRPLCAAFLGLSVLAAERMTDNAYYAMLCDTLDLPEQSDHLPPGFLKQTFEDAWRVTLEEWLQLQGLYLPAPPSQHRFIRLPKMHALLRARDLSKLPDFFLRYNYLPTSQCSEPKLKHDFDAWLTSQHGSITATGRTAWRDQIRQPGIVKQIIRVLECWDGCTSDFNRRNAIQRVYAALHLNLMPRRVLFRVRRKSGFPSTFPFASGNLIAIDEEDYRDLIVPSKFHSRLQFPYEASASSFRIAFRGSNVFAFVNEGIGMGYSQSEHLVLHEKCAVLFLTSIADTVLAHLKLTTDDALEQHDLESTLPGWSMITEFRPSHERATPSELRSLNIEKKLYPRLLGGLKAGQGQTWLAEAPPVRLESVGDQTSHVTINGKVLKLQDGRFLELEECVRDVGLYHISLGERRLVRVISGQLNMSPESNFDLASVDTVKATLAELIASERPDGWLLLGSVPGQVCTQNAVLRFKPQWRLGYQNGVPCTVLLTDVATLPLPTRQLGRSQFLWMRIVLQFASGRLGATAPRATHSEVRRIWECYTGIARGILARQRVSRMPEDDE